MTVSGCSKSSKSSAHSHNNHHHVDKKSKVPQAKRLQDGSWQLAATGSRFEPPVKIDEIPQGAWYCDMGTVHYAQTEAGDKTCKLCKMKLKHKAPASQ